MFLLVAACMYRLCIGRLRMMTDLQEQTYIASAWWLANTAAMCCLEASSYLQDSCNCLLISASRICNGVASSADCNSYILLFDTSSVWIA